MTGNKLPTTASISAMLGVSKSTVSRALNNNPRISEKTRKEIQEAAALIGYLPNANARDLALDKRNLVALVLSEADNYIYQEKIQVLVRLVSERKMQTMVFQSGAKGLLEDVVSSILPYRPAGLIVIPQVSVSEKAIKTCVGHGVKVVLLNREISDSDAFSVSADHADGARNVTKMLIDAGHKRIAFLAGTNTPTFLERERGFNEALQAASLKSFARPKGNFDFSCAMKAVLEMFGTTGVPDAIVVAADLMAFAAIDAAKAWKLSIPEDISIVSFDNSRVGEYPSYDLTTVAQPMADFFRVALDIIVDDDWHRMKTIVPGMLISRGSARL